MRVEKNQRRQNLGLKPVDLVRNFYVSNFNIHVRGNKSAAAKFGLKLVNLVRNLYVSNFNIHARENKSVRQNLGIKLVNLVPNFFSPLAALLSSALELQNIEFSK